MTGISAKQLERELGVKLQNGMADVQQDSPLAERSKLSSAIRSFIFRAIRAVKLLARDGRIPKPLRWLAAIGLLPIPGPVDEVVLLIVGLLMFVFYRDPLREAWVQAADPPFLKSP